MFEDIQHKVMRMTLYRVIKNLENLNEVPVEGFFEAVEKAFNGYNYEGEEELAGREEWPDLSVDGSYKLPVRPDHEEAYELTLYVTCQGCKVTVTNVL